MNNRSKCSVDDNGVYKLNNGDLLRLADSNTGVNSFKLLSRLEDVNAERGVIMGYKDIQVDVLNPEPNGPVIKKTEILDIVEVDGKYQLQNGEVLEEEHQKAIVKIDNKFYIFEVLYTTVLDTVEGAAMESVLTACIDKIHTAITLRTGDYYKTNPHQVILKLQEALMWLKNGQ